MTCSETRTTSAHLSVTGEHIGMSTCANSTTHCYTFERMMNGRDHSSLPPQRRPVAARRRGTFRWEQENRFGAASATTEKGRNTPGCSLALDTSRSDSPPWEGSPWGLPEVFDQPSHDTPARKQSNNKDFKFLPLVAVPFGRNNFSYAPD